jgi:hypothetical protein
MLVNLYNYETYTSHLEEVFFDSVFWKIIKKATESARLMYSSEKIKRFSSVFAFSGSISEDTNIEVNFLLSKLNEFLLVPDDEKDLQQSVDLMFNPTEFFTEFSLSNGSEFIFRLFYFISYRVYTTQTERPIEKLLKEIDFMKPLQDFSLLEDEKLQVYIIDGIDETIIKSLAPIDISLLPEHFLSEFVLLKGKYYNKEDLLKMIDASSSLAQAVEKEDLETTKSTEEDLNEELKDDDTNNNIPQTKRKIRLGK